MRRAWVTFALLCVVNVPLAHADRLGMQAAQLRHSRNYKIRLSAVVSLARTRNSRAIEAISYALIKDPSRTIRRVAALSLGKMIDGSVKRRVRKRGIKALKYAVINDRDSRVRRNARRSLKQLSVLRRVGNQPRRFVTVARAKDHTRRVPRRVKGSMRSLLRYTIRHKVPRFSLTWPTKHLPTRSELRRAGTHAFAVRPIVNRLHVRRRGSRADVHCTVKVRVGPWFGRGSRERWVAGKTAKASGSGMVSGYNSARAIARSKMRCLMAVLEQIVNKQVVPFLRRQ